MDIDTKLTAFFVNYYTQTKIIPDTVVAKEILLKKYNQFLKEGLFEPIENIPLEEKKSLVEECRKMKDTFYTNKTLKQSSMVLYLLKFIKLNS